MKTRGSRAKSAAAAKKARGTAKHAPQKAPAPRPKSRRQIKEEFELLGLLTMLVRERTNLTNKKIANAIDPGHAKVSDTALKRLLQRGAELPDPKDKRLKTFLAQCLRELLAKDRDHILISDLTYLYGTVLKTAGLNYSDLTGISDERPFDRELIDKLSVGTYKPEALLDEVRGFWYVIRYSTDNGAENSGSLNVSLLTVKELNYRPKRHESSVKRMCSYTPHFSLRSARNPSDGTNGAKPHIHRGWVLPTVYPAATLNFLGGRQDEGGPLFTMSLRTNDVPGHATLGRGVSISSNKLSVFACPVAACYIVDSDELHKLRDSDLDGDERDLQVSEQYRDLRDLLMEHVRRYDEAQLVEHLGTHCDAKVLSSALNWLATSKAHAAADRWGGAYSVPDE